MTPTGAPPVKPEFETEIRIIFQLPNSNRETFCPAQQMQSFTRELSKYDSTIAFDALNEGSDLLYPQYDAFPLMEIEFEQHFYLHPSPKKSIRQNMVTIGCQILSVQKTVDLKKATSKTGTLMEWLKSCQIFIEADSLGYCTIRTLGYFFFAHPNIMHCTSLKGVLQETLNDVQLTQDELIEIDPYAVEFYNPKEHCSTEDDKMEELNETNEMPNEECYANVPPFEVYSTPVGYGTSMSRVSTRAMCIKSTVKHGKLLNELLLRMKINMNAFPSIKCIPVGMTTMIGSVPYTTLIQQNNVYLTSVATIAVAGIQDKTLNLKIPVQQAGNRKTQTLQEILMATKWCTQIEPMQTPGRILLITTKSNLDQGHQWLDDNLLSLFNTFLPKNPKFIPNSDTPVAHHIDMRAANKMLADYVEALCQDIKPVATKTNAPTLYARPPPPKTPRLVDISFAQAVKNNL